jgi:hypothetical protein
MKSFAAFLSATSSSADASDWQETNLPFQSFDRPLGLNTF